MSTESFPYDILLSHSAEHGHRSMGTGAGGVGTGVAWAPGSHLNL
jgi:hypothetical protein